MVEQNSNKFLLLKVPLRVWEMSECIEAYGKIPGNQDSVLCALGETDNVKDSCGGDSGGEQ